MSAGRGVRPVLDVAEEVLGAEQGEGRDGGRGRGGAGHQGEAIGGAGHGAASAGHRGQEQQQGRGGGAVHGGGMGPGGGPRGISATPGWVTYWSVLGTSHQHHAAAIIALCRH